MKIHSCQPTKMVQPSEPPCKVQLDAATVSSTPPEDPARDHTHRAGSTTQQQQQTPTPEEGQSPDVLDYRECWYSLQGENRPRHAPNQECPERHNKCQDTAGGPHSRARETQDTSRRGGQRVRHYRKRVSVRWGSLQWSLALVLVVSSRSSSRSCHQRHRHHHHHTSSTPLTVA